MLLICNNIWRHACSSVAVCGSVWQCVEVQQCGSATVCGSVWRQIVEEFPAPIPKMLSGANIPLKTERPVGSRADIPGLHPVI